MGVSPGGVNFTAWLLEAGEPDAIAIVDGERTFTYQQLRSRVRAIATFVRGERAGATQRAPVLILGDNCFDLVAAYLGVLYAGEIATPLSPMSAAALRSVVSETEATLAFADERHHAAVASLVPRAVPLAEHLADGAGDPVAVDAGALAVLMYTSGSTGRPRGVMVSSRNLIANTRSILAFWRLAAADRALVTLPMYYCYGASVMHTHLRVGGSVALTRDQYPERLLDALEHTRATSLASVPSLFEILLGRSTLAKRRLPALRHIMISGGRLHDSSLRRLRQALPAATIFVRYGVTELTAAASYLPPEQLEHKLGSIGRGLPDWRLFVLDRAGDPIRPGSGEIGEIVARGDHVSLGYFRDDADDERAFRDGAFFTGDLATVDSDGYIFIVGRSKEFVKTGGHRIAPQEVEEAIAVCPGVARVGVCGMVHATRGEILIAGVVADPDQPVSVQEIRAHCARTLPAFKVPSWIQLVDALPMTSSGKLDRAQLRELLTPLVGVRR